MNNLGNNKYFKLGIYSFCTLMVIFLCFMIHQVYITGVYNHSEPIKVEKVSSNYIGYIIDNYSTKKGVFETNESENLIQLPITKEYKKGEVVILTKSTKSIPDENILIFKAGVIPVKYSL